jgi:hypothetical protein
VRRHGLPASRAVRPAPLKSGERAGPIAVSYDREHSAPSRLIELARRAVRRPKSARRLIAPPSNRQGRSRLPLAPSHSEHSQSRIVKRFGPARGLAPEPARRPIDLAAWAFRAGPIPWPASFFFGAQRPPWPKPSSQRPVNAWRGRLKTLGSSIFRRGIHRPSLGSAGVDPCGLPEPHKPKRGLCPCRGR